MPQKDLRDTDVYRQAAAIYENLRQPGTGQISDAAEVDVAPDSHTVVFAGAIMDALQGSPPSRVCETELASGSTRVLTFGPNTDRLPKYSRDGRQVAFLSDRRNAGDFQLFLLDRASGAARCTPPVSGWVEYLHWSPDGRRILLGVAEHGADVAGSQGAITSKSLDAAVPSWMPFVQDAQDIHRGRNVWIYEVESNTVRSLPPAELNVWEAVWCGNDAIAAVVSDGPGEGSWYSARLLLIPLHGGGVRTLYTPKDQLGWPAAAPSGQLLAVVEAICSDRWVVAGELRLVEVATGKVTSIDTRGIDISFSEWRGNDKLLLAGHRGLHTVVGLFDVATATVTELWCSAELTTGGRCIALSGIGSEGDCALIGEGFVTGPEIAVIRRGQYQPVRSCSLGYDVEVRSIASVDSLEWQASDGLTLQGWLLRPAGPGPHPLVMNVHGGPVSHWRPTWLGRRSVALLMLLRQGYALFFPNPRGSSGRGRDFAGRVVGDMGGADTHDYLSGLDHLVKRGWADPKRLGVTGGSYGGFMTAWLITQDGRFAAAVAVAPVTNQVTERLISNIPHFTDLFLADSYENATGRYFLRSPIMYASAVKTPTLNICGALDRCTPPEEAVQFHNALLENNVESVLVTYPEEGHGVRKLPAAMDFAARVVTWFLSHMPP